MPYGAGKPPESSPESSQSLDGLLLLFGSVLVYLVAMLGLRAVGAEPYPAVLLPAGGGVHERTVGPLHFERTDLVACDVRRVCVDVSMHDLLAAFPGSVRPYIVDNRFGLAPSADGYTALPTRATRSAKTVTTSDQDATRRWLSDRLELLTGQTSAELRLVRRTYEVWPTTPRDYVMLDEAVEAVIDL